MSDRLVEWIKSKEAEGYSPQQIYQYFIQQGYNPTDISKAINDANIPIYDFSSKEVIAVPDAKISTIDADENQDKPFIQKLMMWLILFFVIIIILGVTFYIYEKKSLNYNPNLNSTPEDLAISFGCEEYSCFNEYFSRCERAKATNTIGLLENLSYYYEILGPKEGLCEVKSKFIQNPNPEWIDKEMTCLYNNTMDFETAVTYMDKCEGPLYTMITQEEPGTDLI
ncbi:MAG: hypothetical protein ACP5NW_05395 [Candidatus Woesearchaeota archaeon]